MQSSKVTGTLHSPEFPMAKGVGAHCLLGGLMKQGCEEMKLWKNQKLEDAVADHCYCYDVEFCIVTPLDWDFSSG